MSSGESDSHDAPQKPDDESMSVDRLTQAFAQLMGEGSADSAPSEDVAEEDTGDDSQPGHDDLVQEDEEAHVTPSSIVEAILFVGHPQNSPLTSRMIAGLLRGVSPQEVDQIVVELNEGYEAGGAPYTIVSDAAGYRMTLRGEFARLRESFYGKVREAKLSQVAIDLLAIVAYQQPISRERIDQMRGQPCGGILSQLVRRELLTVELTKDRPRKKLYRTTDRFLQLFGLETVEDLPSYDEI